MDKQEISETKSSLTKKQNSQTLARWIRKKKKKEEEGSNYQNQIWNWGNITNFTEIKYLWKYYEYMTADWTT